MLDAGALLLYLVLDQDDAARRDCRGGCRLGGVRRAIVLADGRRCEVSRASTSAGWPPLAAQAAMAACHAISRLGAR